LLQNYVEQGAKAVAAASKPWGARAFQYRGEDWLGREDGKAVGKAIRRVDRVVFACKRARGALR
jgi:hypothetical protein